MKQSNSVSKWHKVIAIMAIIWNLLGVGAYLKKAYTTDETIMLLPEAERALYLNIPAWYTAAFAIAVFAGFVGSILLLMNKKIASNLLTLSLLGVFVQMYFHFFLSNAMDVYGLGSAVMPVLVIVIAVFLVWHVRNLQAMGKLS